jgi:hypothetical protein
MLSLISIILIPLAIVVVRLAMRWATLVSGMTDLIKNNDEAHVEIVKQMGIDRSATNQRLRYLEEYFMQNGMRLRR